MTNDESLFARVLLPVASEADAEATAVAARSHLERDERRATVVHVIEKAGGAPDKASVEQREAQAKSIFARVDDVFGPAGIQYETRILYGTDVAETIIDAAAETDASAIAFTPRQGSRWLQLLTGDVSLSLVTDTDRPVIVLPDVEEEVAADG